MEDKLIPIGDWMQSTYPDLDPTMPEFTKAMDREQAKRNIGKNKTATDGIRDEAIGNLKKQKRDGTGGGKMKNALDGQKKNRTLEETAMDLDDNNKKFSGVGNVMNRIFSGFGSNE